MIVFCIMNMTVVFLIVMMIVAFIRILGVESDAQYIKMEMKRATYLDEYEYWRRELKKLYLRQIPFVGNLLCKKIYEKNK